METVFYSLILAFLIWRVWRLERLVASCAHQESRKETTRTLKEIAEKKRKGEPVYPSGESRGEE